MSTHVPYWNLRNKYSPPLQRWLTQSEAAEVYTEAEKAFVPPLRRQTALLSIKEEDSEEETMDYESDPEQDEPEEVRQHAFVQRRGNTRYICPRGCETECSHSGILHVHLDCECPSSGRLHWHEGLKSGRQSSNQSNDLREGSQGKIRLQTLGGVGWSWRRICYTLKGDRILNGDIDPSSSQYFRLTSNGMVRLVHQEPSSRTIETVFQGQQGQDWENAMNAKVDTRNISVMYDRIRTIQSGNESGVSRHYNLWHPMNKNIVYEDEEAGDSMFTSAVSTESRAGMGDYYVTDFFEPNRGGVAGDDDLEFQPHATFYWHEK